MIKPGQEMIKPAQVMIKPAQEMIKPAEIMIKPAQEIIESPQEMFKPAQEMIKPALEMIKQKQDTPALEISKPVQEILNMGREIKTSGQEKRKPVLELPKPSQETVKLRPKRPVPLFYLEEADEADVDVHENLGSFKKAKPCRNDFNLPPPNENTCKMSNDIRDCCKTLCKVCDQPYPLYRMRSHTLSQHKLQISKYKEIHGPFVIINVVYHKMSDLRKARLAGQRLPRKSHQSP